MDGYMYVRLSNTRALISIKSIRLTSYRACINFRQFVEFALILYYSQSQLVVYLIGIWSISGPGNPLNRASMYVQSKAGVSTVREWEFEFQIWLKLLKPFLVVWIRLFFEYIYEQF